MATGSAAHVELQVIFHQQGREHTRKRLEILCLFEMAPQDGVHLQRARFWMASKSQIMSLGRRATTWMGQK